jgi:peptidoglycan/xylan/chitin deacetylase (PgdA/CDA1 family)
MSLSLHNKQKVKRLVSLAYRRLGLNGAQHLSIILNYHSIHPTHHSSTRPEDFLAQMAFLKEHFAVISLRGFFEARAANRTLPGKVAMITFDDGYRDNYDYAFPVLQELGLTATVFLATGFIDGELDITREWGDYQGLDHLNWRQVKEMNENGLHIGAHTHTHSILSRLSSDEVEKEIFQSKHIIEEKLGERVSHFAYPLGQPHTFERSVVDVLRRHGFDLACSTIWGTDNRRTDMFALRRIRIDVDDSIADFINKVYGAWDFVRYFQVLRAYGSR